jgi:hypothetical protein
MLFEPQNDLEKLLLRAAKDPGARPDFYRAFLNSELYVLGELVEAGHVYIREVHKEGYRLIPCFSSLIRIGEYVPTGEKSVKLKGAALLDVISTSTEPTQVVLNPGSQSGKLFTPGEIKGLRDGTIFHQTQDLPLQAGQEVLLTLPPHPPKRFVDSLHSLLAKRPQVRRAYLAQMQVQPHPAALLVALVANDEAAADDPELRRVMADCALIARETLIPGALVNYMKLGDSAMDQFFAQIEPFYEQ